MAIFNYFKNGVYKRHLFNFFFFTDKDYRTFSTISFSQRRNQSVWLTNNLFFPIIVIFFPIVFTFIHIHWGTVQYDKTLLEIAISGSLTLTGYNVLRSASTYVSAKLDESKIPAELRDVWPEVQEEIRAMKSSLRTRVTLFSFIGGALYIIQVIQLINASNPAVFAILTAVAYVVVASVIMGRFLYLLETNFLDDDNVINVLFTNLRTREDEYKKLEHTLVQNGLQL